MPPTSDGGARITSYQITAYDMTTSSFLGTAVAPGSAMSLVYTGLNDGDIYDFAVAARNSVGIGPVVYTNRVSPPNTTLS